MKHVKLYEEYLFETDSYIEKKEKLLPKEIDNDKVHSLVDALNKDFVGVKSSNKNAIEFEYSIPYPDASSKDGVKHKAIEGKWWAGINILLDGDQIGTVKYVRDGNEWKYFNFKLHSDYKKSEIEKLLSNYFKNK